MFLMVLTASAFTQSSNWEFGIGLRPFTMKESPYSFIFKKYLSNKTALRLGVSANYDTHNEDIRYIHPYDSLYSFRYEYNQQFRNLTLTSFFGLQYGKRNNNFYFYSATDVSIKYKRNSSNFSSNGIFYPGIIKLRPNDYFKVADVKNNTTITLGGNQILGCQYFVTQNISLSIESGLYISLDNINREETFQYVKSDNLSNVGFGTLTYADLRKWNFQMSVGALGMFSFLYHF
jgi:hypothetical protein